MKYTKEQIISELTSLKESQAWKIICELISTNDIPALRMQMSEVIKSGNASRLQQIDQIQHKIDVMEEVCKLPDLIIQKNTEVQQVSPSTDPYFQREDIENPHEAK